MIIFSTMKIADVQKQYFKNFINPYWLSRAAHSKGR